MLLILALIVIALFAGLGFVAKVLWWGLVLGAILLVASFVAGRRF